VIDQLSLLFIGISYGKAPITSFIAKTGWHIQDMPKLESLLHRLPPHAYFMVSALFHYLGPSFAVLLFAHVGPWVWHGFASPLPR
jgi:hypothetical protein